jgi:hypothetical protein
MLRGLFLLAATAAVALASASANATIYVSGDSNIFTNTTNSEQFTEVAANQRFLRNIAGSNVLIQSSATYGTGVGGAMGGYLTSQGIANLVIASNTSLTAADLTGRSLFIGFLPTDGYTPSELAALSAFIMGGGNVILTGENGNSLFTVSNAAINSALMSLGSSMRIGIDAGLSGYQTATILTANTATAGTAGFQFAAPSLVTGGTGLYATTSNGVFLAFENVTAGVPEPATWVMMLVGFGAIGGTLRRHQKVATRVRFA